MSYRIHLRWRCLAFLLMSHSSVQAQTKAELSEVKILSSLDGTQQPAKVWAPATAEQEATPLLLFLHSWSGDYRQNNNAWLKQAKERGWIFLHPNFRGRNDDPEACGSKLARQDILDALTWAKANYQVDSKRVYLAGTSGGGHMAMLMAGTHPDRFSAVSSWVGISDLAEWHRFHAPDGKPKRYAKMLEQCCGGPPGTSEKADAEYKDRSPITHLHQAKSLPIFIAAGLHDGHTGSVPITHSLRAFNIIAKAGGHTEVSQAEMEELANDRPLTQPQPGDMTENKSLKWKTYLHRRAGVAEVVIFEGGHEGRPQIACDWLAKQSRDTNAGAKTLGK